MAAPGGDHVYATLLLSDSYLPGALVLAHSLRDAGTRIKLAVLVTLDSVSADSIAQLRTVYDYIFPVPRIRNDRPANLHLMNRADLHSAFTKINLWKLTEFSKIVYIDADVVAYRAPDELFSITQDFAAAPDIGWPDLFNTGVMVLKPNMGDYYAMMAMAERGISFDGADQGLINMHFGNRYHRLSFTYNVTPSAHYQYVPAYRHFQSSINMVHFIGSNKPWFTGRDAPHGSGPFDEMVGRWWAVYDRHFRAKESAAEPGPPPSEYVQYFTKGEFHPQPAPAQPGTAMINPGITTMNTTVNMDTAMNTTVNMDTTMNITVNSMVIIMSPIMMLKPRPGHQALIRPPLLRILFPKASLCRTIIIIIIIITTTTIPILREECRLRSTNLSHALSQCTAGMLKGKLEVSHSYTTGQVLLTLSGRQPPPSDSKPEAIDFPSTHYEMSEDAAPFVPPARYPSPPRNMWYEVPKERPAPPSQAPSEIFPWERNRPPPTRSFVGEPPVPPPPEEPPAWGEPLEESSVIGSITSDAKSEPSTPTTPALKSAPLDPWTSFTRVNAWDDVPEIERYVEGLQGPRRGKTQGSTRRPGGIKGFGTGDGGGLRLHGLKLTDFPTEAERPSLPVTPAPIRRPSFWSGGGTEAVKGDEPRQLPEAEGVPAQSEWDPMEQLQKLAKKQSDVLRQRFGSSGEEEGQEGESAGSAPGVLSPQPVKGEATTSILRSMSSDNFDPAITPKPSSIPLPSFSGPGPAWDKDDVILERQTPLLPTDEERDVLDT
ncbi:hypothetical protein G7Z17_g7451 [Cylindrodendrum hubeiense]|uniref:glycogenin glucosyltransferase n=1 Tax=Cylindrodendrum hubeiense TaxID=595255 RepID=A0A9P5H7V8_9HYPO|nr:hypothetical protein G7Z17_g7451 [Cylindrodendrum hubeiense]